jgi:hypothetical protein
MKKLITALTLIALPLMTKTNFETTEFPIEDELYITEISSFYNNGSLDKVRIKDSYYGGYYDRELPSNIIKLRLDKTPLADNTKNTTPTVVNITFNNDTSNVLSIEIPQCGEKSFDLFINPSRLNENFLLRGSIEAVLSTDTLNTRSITLNDDTKLCIITTNDYDKLEITLNENSFLVINNPSLEKIIETLRLKSNENSSAVLKGLCIKDLNTEECDDSSIKTNNLVVGSRNVSSTNKTMRSFNWKSKNYN